MMPRVLTIVVVGAVVAVSASAAPPTTCGAGDAYSEALCAYQRRNFGDAEERFRQLFDAGAEDPVTMRAAYFLARTLMKTGRYAEAADLLVRIYSLDKPFYDAWSCDFLLGECRKALGK
jgi:TolA-binding protein